MVAWKIYVKTIAGGRDTDYFWWPFETDFKKFELRIEEMLILHSKILMTSNAWLIFCSCFVATVKLDSHQRVNASIFSQLPYINVFSLSTSKMKICMQENKNMYARSSECTFSINPALVCTCVVAIEVLWGYPTCSGVPPRLPHSYPTSSSHKVPEMSDHISAVNIGSLNVP